MAGISVGWSIPSAFLIIVFFLLMANLRLWISYFKAVHPPLFLRSSSVPKSVQSRCKVGERAEEHRVWYGGIREDYGNYSLSSLPLQRYFLVSCTIIPERNSNDKRFGIAIRALKISAKSQTRLRLTTAPR